MRLFFSPSIAAAVLTNAPRLVLISITPSFIMAMVCALIRCCVCSVSGQWSEIISAAPSISINGKYSTPAASSCLLATTSNANTLQPKPNIILQNICPILPVPITPMVLLCRSNPVNLSNEKLPSLTLLYALCVFRFSVKINATACSATA